MTVLREYHGALGPLIHGYEGTLDRFTGDGLIVIFNDPVPCPDPALRAVRLALDMRSAVIGNILAKNPKITTHAGNKSPFCYLDWWPNSLWMNTQIAPYNDARVRRAISLVINRDQINDVIYEGAKIATAELWGRRDAA